MPLCIQSMISISISINLKYLKTKNKFDWITWKENI